MKPHHFENKDLYNAFRPPEGPKQMSTRADKAATRLKGYLGPIYEQTERILEAHGKKRTAYGESTEAILVERRNTPLGNFLIFGEVKSIMDHEVDTLPRSTHVTWSVSRVDQTGTLGRRVVITHEASDCDEIKRTLYADSYGPISPKEAKQAIKKATSLLESIAVIGAAAIDTDLNPPTEIPLAADS